MPKPDPIKEDIHLQSSHLPNGREIDDGDTVYFDRRLSRPDCQLPDWDIPDAAYRPVPIVWFFSAWLAQTFSMGAIFLVLAGFSSILALAVSLLASGLVGMWTWDRGMSKAGQGWQIATAMMLGGQFAFAAMLVFA
jgi:hypothetical protein